MSDGPTKDMRILLFYAVVRDPQEFTPSEHVKTKNSQIRAYAEKTRLLKCRPSGRALYLSANDATWRWVEEHLEDELPRTKSAFLIFDELRSRLARYLAIRGIRFADVFAPQVDPLAQTMPEGCADRVRRAYLDLSSGQFDVRVRLRDLRPRLEGLSRARQDEALRGMERDRWLVLYPNDDPQDRNADDDAAAIVIGDRHRDLVYLHREQRQ